jgi:hypothetical protein
MKNNFSLSVAALILLFAITGTSCKKKIHSNAPTPNNVRMVGYTKITTIKMTVPVAGVPSTINENYRFYYDEQNRVSRVIYTGNDSFEIHKTITFKYSGDTIYKTILNVLNNSFVEKDTFVTNSEGLIVSSFTPNLIDRYEYYGQLLARTIRTATSYRHINMTAQTTYTSVNGDFLKNYYDGVLTTDFNNLRTPLDGIYEQVVSPTKVNTTVLNNYNSMTHTMNGYNYSPIFLYVIDTTYDSSPRREDSLVYPGSEWVNESYHFWTEDANRTGDYLQLLSFTMFGNNIYRNKHLVESISSRNKNAYITYAIDASSKITQTKVVLVDSLLNNYTSVFDIQYETY